MNTQNPYQIAAFLTFLSTTTLAVFVLARGMDRSVTRRFGIYTLAISVWSFGWMQMVRSVTPSDAVFWIRILNFCANFIPATFLHFVQYFLNNQQDKRQILLRRIFYGFSLLFAILIPFPSYIRGAAPKPGFALYLDAGPLFIYFFIYFVIAVSTTCSLLYANLKKAPIHQRRQIGYVLAAYVAAYAGGTPAFLPVYGYEISPYLLYLIPIGHVVIAYAIFAHQLLEIQVVIRRTLIYSFITAALAAMYVGAMTLFVKLVEMHVSSASLMPVFPLFMSCFVWLRNMLQSGFVYACIVTSIMSVVLGTFVWSQGRTKPANLLWFWMCVCVGMWSFGLGMMASAHTAQRAYFWQTWFLYVGACLIPTIFLHFVSLVVKYPIPRILILSYAVSLLELFLNLSGRLATVAPKPPFAFYTVPYSVYASYMLFFMVVASFAHVILFKKFAILTGQAKEQIRYIAVGTGVGFIGGATTFLYTYDVLLFPYGMYLVPAYTLTVSYAIFKHRLLDISVVIRKTLMYSLITAALISIYTGIIALAAHFIGFRSGSASAISSTLTAILIALLFHPLRIHIQSWIDHHFPREKLDPALLQEAAGGFAHEMKRPLTKISLPAESLLIELEQVKSGDKTWEEYIPRLEDRLKFIISQSAEAAYMIEAVRELSATSAVSFEPVDLNIVIASALAAEHDLLKRRGVTVHLDVPKNMPAISGRPKQLEIVFVNLIKNAAEAMADLPAGKVRDLTIEGESNGSHLTIRVIDTGPGIKPENASKIFLPNYSTKGPHGTGMGLYLSKQIIEGHQGRIDIANQSDGGSTATVIFTQRKSI